MSEADTHQATSILLPTSGIAVYAKDAETHQAARDIENDWRFARVNLLVEEGDVKTAISAYKELSSPDLIILQTDNIDDEFTAALEELAGVCDEGTAAIVIGPVNDVNLYRSMIDMGVSDYLVRPIESPVLADVMAKTLIERLGVTGSRLIAFLGSKGGVGTSILAQGAACGVSEILEQKTMLLDTSGGWSANSVGLGYEPSTTLSEAARAAASGDEDSLKRMLFQATDKLSVLASGGDALLDATITPEQLEELIDMLMVTWPVVIADLSQSPGPLRKAVVTRANQIVVVSNPTLPALRLGRSLIQEIKELRGGEEDGIELIINMQGQFPANEVPKGDIETAMEFAVSTTLPYAPKAFLGSESESRKLTDDKEAAPLVKNTLLPIVQKVVSAVPEEESGDQGTEKGLLSGFLGKLSSKS